MSRKYRRLRGDVQPLIEKLQAGGTPGEQIQGVGHTVFKVRLRNSDAQRGKSGGYRVIYYLVTDEHALLVTLYSKTEQSDIDTAELAAIIQQEDERK